MAAIDILNVDVLLVVFNLLTLYDKLRAMMVNKKWYKIMRDTHAWPVIDFYEEGPTIIAPCKHYKRFIAKQGNHPFEFRELTNRWRFPRYEEDVVRFLHLFAGVALCEVYLCVVSNNIMDILIKNCPNVHTICFVENNFSFEVDVDDVDTMLHIPPTLKRFEMFAPPVPYQEREENHEDEEFFFPARLLDEDEEETDRSRRKKLRDDKILSRLGQCPELRHITLRNHNLTTDGIQKLIQNTKLSTIDFEFDALTDDIDEIISSTIGSLRTVTELRLSRRVRYIYSLQDVLSCIGEWKHLRLLALKGFGYTADSFERMIPGILNLEYLEVSGTTTEFVVSAVGKYLLKLRCLKIIAPYHSFNNGLQPLYCHPSLETLSIFCSHNEQQNRPDPGFFHSLFDVLPTLPNIKMVKLASARLPCLFNQGKFPVIESVDIEIVDTEREGSIQGTDQFCDSRVVKDQEKWTKS